MQDIVDFVKSFDFHTIIIVGIAFFFLRSGLNSKLDIIQSEMIALKTEITELKTDIAVIKAVLVMKNLMPPELCKHEENK